MNERVKKEGDGSEFEIESLIEGFVRVEFAFEREF